MDNNEDIRYTDIPNEENGALLYSPPPLGEENNNEDISNEENGPLFTTGRQNEVIEPEESRIKGKYILFVLLLFVVFCISIARKEGSTLLEGTETGNTKDSVINLPTLENLMYKYGSDKSRDDHGYTKFYQMIFDPIRIKTKMVLELGFAAGQSLQAWNDYFPNAQIHGIDIGSIDEKVKINLEKLKRVKTYLFDVTKSNSLEEHGLLNETFDIIIEDGPHTPQSQETFLNILFPLLKPGGFYIIEDLCGHTGGKERFHSKPELLQEAARTIIDENNSILIDTAVGHRAWDQWQKAVGRYAKDHLKHNSYLFVIQKRLPNDYHKVQINFGNVAMQANKIVEST